MQPRQTKSVQQNMSNRVMSNRVFTTSESLFIDLIIYLFTYFYVSSVVSCVFHVFLAWTRVVASSTKTTRKKLHSIKYPPSGVLRESVEVGPCLCSSRVISCYQHSGLLMSTKRSTVGITWYYEKYELFPPDSLLLFFSVGYFLKRPSNFILNSPNLLFYINNSPRSLNGTVILSLV